MQKTGPANSGNPITFREANRFYKLAIATRAASTMSQEAYSRKLNRLISFSRKLVEKSAPHALAEMREMGVESIPAVGRQNVLDIGQAITLQVVSKEDVPLSLLQIINSMSEYKKGDGRFSLRGQTGASVVAHIIGRSQYVANHQNAIAVNIYGEVWRALNTLATEQLTAEAKARA